MSRANVPPVKDALIVDSSPTVALIGVKVAIIALLIVYSGLVADSDEPAGEITRVVVPAPTAAKSVASADPAP